MFLDGFFMDGTKLICIWKIGDTNYYGQGLMAQHMRYCLFWPMGFIVLPSWIPMQKKPHMEKGDPFLYKLEYFLTHNQCGTNDPLPRNIAPPSFQLKKRLAWKG